MTDDVEGGNEVGYHEHAAAASGPRGHSQRTLSNTDTQSTLHSVIIKETEFILKGCFNSKSKVSPLLSSQSSCF